MKPSQWAALQAVVVGTIVTVLLGWFLLSGAVWWVNLIVWLLTSAGAYKAGIEMMGAREDHRLKEDMNDAAHVAFLQRCFGRSWRRFLRAFRQLRA